MSELSKEDLRKLGDTHRSNGEYEEAIVYYTKAIELDNNYVDAYNGRGTAYKDQGRYEEAIADYTKAIEIDPNYKFGYRNRGLVYKNQGKYKEAIADYTRAIELDNNYVDAYNSMAIAYENQGRYEEAIADYTKAIEIDPNYKFGYRNRGLVYKKQGKYKEAIADYTRAIEIDNNYVDAYNSRGIAYENQGRYEEAIADYTKAIEIDSNYKFGYRSRGLVYNKLGRYEEAIADYTRAIGIDQNYVTAYNDRGIAYYNQKKYEKAVADYIKAIEIDINYKYAYNNIGLVYFKQGKYEEAIEEYTKAIYIDSDFKQAYKNREIANKKLGNSDKADKDLYEFKIRDIKSRDENFYNYIKKIDISMEKKAQISDLFLTVMKLKDKLLYKDIKAVGHYTKISNLKYLVKPRAKMKKDEKEARLRLNNVAYMNDPTEGEVFLKLLKQSSGEDTKSLIEHLYRNPSENSREVITGKNYVFLVSFSTAIDTSLPMWVQYSENGTGCCLVFDTDFFDEEDKNCLIHASNADDEKVTDMENEEDSKINYYCLYQIKYVESKKEEYKLDDEDFNKLIKEIVVMLKAFRGDLENINNSPIKGIVQNILDQVRFLFKDKNYDYEEEVRLVKFEDNGNVKYTGDAEGFIVPRVYIELDRELKLQEIILGPKAQNAVEVSNYLYYTEKVKEVSKSRIKYK